MNTSLSTHYSINNSENIDSNIKGISSEKNSIFNFVYKIEQENISYNLEYIEDIYYNLLKEEKEIEIRPIYGYMAKQKDINEQMRAILVDWLIDVHYNFNFNKETLFQTIWILDTYLSYEIIQRNKLQLLGITCLFISCKYNEICYPKTNEFIYVTDNAYDIKELLKMEKDVLKKLEFNILVPTSIQFYDILSKIFNFNSEQYNFGRYFLESNLIDYNMICFSSSIIAISSAYIVMKFFNIKDYEYLYLINDKNNDYISKENIKTVIKESARNLCFLVKNISQSSLKAVKNKFSLKEYDFVSQYCEDD